MAFPLYEQQVLYQNIALYNFSTIVYFQMSAQIYMRYRLRSDIAATVAYRFVVREWVLSVVLQIG